MEIFNIITLSLSGLLLFFVGTMRLMNPIKAYSKNSGITLDKNADLLNEMRGVSSVMLFGGLLILSGILFSEITFASHIIAILLFFGFAIGRIASISADGKPNKMIIQGLIFELVFGTMNTVCILVVL